MSGPFLRIVLDGCLCVISLCHLVRAATSISESGRKLALQSCSLASMQSRKFCPPVLREIAHLLRVHVKALALVVLVVAHA